RKGARRLAGRRLRRGTLAGLERVVGARVARARLFLQRDGDLPLNPLSNVMHAPAKLAVAIKPLDQQKVLAFQFHWHGFVTSSLSSSHAEVREEAKLVPR